MIPRDRFVARAMARREMRRAMKPLARRLEPDESGLGGSERRHWPRCALVSFDCLAKATVISVSSRVGRYGKRALAERPGRSGLRPRLTYANLMSTIARHACALRRLRRRADELQARMLALGLRPPPRSRSSWPILRFIEVCRFTGLKGSTVDVGPLSAASARTSRAGAARQTPAFR
jgi:hypothetical protein